MNRNMPDRPGVLVFPPLIPIGVLILGLGLDRWLPYEVLTRLPHPLRFGIGGVLICLGGALALAGGLTLRHAGTNINPRQPTRNLALRGIYSRTRNPMYLGGSLALAGLAVLLASDWMLLLLLLALPILHYGVVRREERYLIAKFGEPYRHYMAVVPRYGWRW
jgi:protein-S-isoprenylcysteine O-methyltransferase Ste14